MLRETSCKWVKATVVASVLAIPSISRLIQLSSDESYWSSSTEHNSRLAILSTIFKFKYPLPGQQWCHHLGEGLCIQNMLGLVQCGLASKFWTKMGYKKRRLSVLNGLTTVHAAMSPTTLNLLPTAMGGVSWSILHWSHEFTVDSMP